MRGAGRLRQRVWVRTFSKTKNAAMEIVEDYSPGTEVPCELSHMMGTERLENQREGNEAPVRVRFRYEEGLVSAKDILENRDASPIETYDVISVYPDRKRRELIADCKLHT